MERVKYAIIDPATSRFFESFDWTPVAGNVLKWTSDAFKATSYCRLVETVDFLKRVRAQVPQARLCQITFTAAYDEMDDPSIEALYGRELEIYHRHLSTFERDADALSLAAWKEFSQARATLAAAGYDVIR